MTDQNDPIIQIQREEELEVKKIADKQKKNDQDLVEKRTEYEAHLAELKENLKQEGMKSLQKAKAEAGETYKKMEETSRRQREGAIREAEQRTDQAVAIIEKTFTDFIKA